MGHAHTVEKVGGPLAHTVLPPLFTVSSGSDKMLIDMTKACLAQATQVYYYPDDQLYNYSEPSSWTIIEPNPAMNASICASICSR